LSSIFPIACNLVYVFDVNPVPGLDWTLVGFITSGLIMGWAILRMGLLSIVPVARHAVFDQMSDGALVLDRDGRFLDCNGAFCAIAGLGRSPAPGSSVSGLLGDLGLQLKDLLVGGSTVLDSHAAGSGAEYHVHVSQLSGGRGESGYLVTLHDTTALHHLREEREKLLADIRAAQSEIRKLSGLLPICAECKRIRNDQGYWQRVESYIHTHTNVKFTHGLCPACMRNHLGAALSEDLEPEFGLDRMLD
jgi:PAS domain S-box-containing protein